MIESPEKRARAFLDFCTGAEEGGLTEYACRGRMVARDLLGTLEALAVERSARVAIQARADRFEAIALRNRPEGDLAA